MNNLKGLLWLTLLFGWSGSGFSQAVNSTQFHEPVDVPSATIARLKALYESNEFAVRSFNASWLPDASGYLVLETIAGTGRQVLAGYDVVTGKRTEWVSAEQLVLPKVTMPLVIDRFDISPDGGKILLQAHQKAGGSGSNYHWILDRKSGSLLKVAAGRNSSISPDGTRILYEDRGNLIIYDSTRDLITPITHDAVDGTITYERAEWSPDGKKVAFVLSDDSRVSIRSSLVPGDPSYPEVNETRFARVGGIIPSLRVGVADIEGKEITWLPVPVPLEGYYLGQVGWAGNSHELLIEKFSRFRDKREFFLADLTSGAFSRIYEESDPAWVIASYATNDGLEWIRNYQRFYRDQ
jgi:dipeptidyl-peptidase 4